MSALSSLKILDFSTLLPGPFGTLMLADLGAGILRVEAPDRPELSREVGAKDGNASYLHRYLNRSKKSIALDLKKPEAVEIVKRLIMDYDILVEQYRPGVMAKLGLDYDTLGEVNPRLIYCSLTGYGQTGPYRNRAGHDNNYLSIAGIQDHSRRKGQAPVPAGVQIADVAGGSLHLVAGLLAAVVQRTETGLGQHVDVSMTDAAFTLNAIPAADFLGAGIDTGPERGLLNGGGFYDYYETADGRYFSVGGLEPKFRETLCTALGRPELLELAFSEDEDAQRRFKEEIAQAIKSRSYEACLMLFREVDACVEPVLTLGEACGHEQFRSRDMIVEVDGIRQIGCAIKMSGSEPVYAFKGGEVGQNTEQLIRELDFTEDQMNRFRASGVFGK
ncbi:CaiB/BaiF CoA transferase family protein [Emcibacter nanhaiensis]|uniref:CoA transferase n=1 Tax=Emcibacter nanhaiensis TaxID=1505037 RepID=A0A501PFN8_9PROT|nr:CaiB/BaiF CoA-transferase family protein [Emcibacter nanhaiensis]TPD59279.1 CoA transferase [Emcibacter nanhaiensis]